MKELDQLTVQEVPIVRTEMPGPRSKAEWGREHRHASPGLSAAATLSQIVLDQGRGSLVRDIDGNVWCSMGWADPKEDGVRCYSPSGDLLGKIHLPETCANLCFGGPLRNRLFVCGSTSVYALYVGTQGALKP